MLTYIARRMLQAIPVLIGVTFLIFILMFILPGDPAQMLAPKGASPQMLENISQKYHLDKPWYVQYVGYMGKLSKGDLGQSIRYQRPVTQIMKDCYPNSIRLALLAVLIELVIGVGAGIISAVKKRSFWDVLVTLSTAVLISAPVFWLAMLLQVSLGLKFHLLPISGLGDGSWRYYVLPATTLAAVSAAYVARLTRSSMLEVMKQDYIQMARAKGLSPVKIIGKHALKNALIPVITLIALDLGVLIGGAVLIETVFSWPGVGREIYLAILRRDTPVVMGGVLILVSVFIVLNLVVDISYAYLDPRIRYEGGGK